RAKNPTPTKKTEYAKVKVSRPPIALEPKAQYIAKESEEVQKIQSEKNPEQTDDLKIQYHPNQFFEQDELYAYPVVKMPKEGSYLKLPRKGRAQGRGYKERDFYRTILAQIQELEIAVDLHMAIPHFNKPYEPDIV